MIIHLIYLPVCRTELINKDMESMIITKLKIFLLCLLLQKNSLDSTWLNLTIGLTFRYNTLERSDLFHVSLSAFE